MPWTPAEDERVKRIEERVAKTEQATEGVKRDVRDIESAQRRAESDAKHERETFLAAATRSILAAVDGKFARLDQLFYETKGQTETLDGLREELALAKKERERRRARERHERAMRVARKKQAREERKKAEGQRLESARRWKRFGLLVPLIVGVLGLLAATVASHLH